jgi:hypothetical protein
MRNACGEAWVSPTELLLTAPHSLTQVRQGPSHPRGTVVVHERSYFLRWTIMSVILLTPRQNTVGRCAHFLQARAAATRNSQVLGLDACEPLSRTASPGACRAGSGSRSGSRGATDHVPGYRTAPGNAIQVPSLCLDVSFISSFTSSFRRNRTCCVSDSPSVIFPVSRSTRKEGKVMSSFLSSECVSL